LVVSPTLLVIALDAAPVWPIPHIQGYTHSWLPGFTGPRIVVNGRPIGRLQHGASVPDPFFTVPGEVQSMDLGHDEIADPVLAETKVPNAPIHHQQAALLQVDDDFRGRVVGDVDPE